MTERKETPFRQIYPGEILGQSESAEAKSCRLQAITEFNERQKVLEEIARRDAEIYELKKNEALEIGIDADALSNASAST